MHNLRRRIEALERAWAAARKDRQEIAKKALNSYPSLDAEQLISAFGAEREGRDLSAGESAAKQAYTEALSRECRWAGYPPIEGFDAFDVRDAVPMALARRTSPEELKLAIRGREALLKGRTISPEESAAFQAVTAEWIRLKRLAGLPVPAGADVHVETRSSL